MVCEAVVQLQQDQHPKDSTRLTQEGIISNQQIVHFNWDQRAQAKACMQTLVMALADDPVNSYFSGRKRVKFCKDEVKGYLKALPDAANFIATADSMAVALWQLLPHETPRNELWAGWTRILRVPPRLWRQLVKLELRYEAAHDAAAQQFGSYYYLSFIGSRPEVRGRGYGSLLLNHITQKADAEGRWCMLEATSELSQALYGRHGFVTHEVYRVSKNSPPVFLMKRAPVIPLTPAATAAAATLAPPTSTPLSAAALQLAAAVNGKLLVSASPGSECGHSTCSSMISAVVRGHAVDSESDEHESVSDIEEENEEEEESDGSHVQQQVACVVSPPADARVIIRSNSGCSKAQSKAQDESEIKAAEIILPITADGGDSECKKQHDIDSSRNRDSSSSAGAGGPSDAAAGSA